MSRIGLGFDTGGTYTDAVIMDLETDTILARNKALTTRFDLSVGIRNAIAGFDRDLLDRVSTVSLSSTLATNFIVEGKGCRVGLVCIGHDLDIDAKVDEIVTVDGFFTPLGKEEEALDEEKVREFLESIRGKVDCIAVTGFMSVRNPKHEIRVKELAKEILGIPTVCGHDLSSGLGFNERAITSVMNARLIPTIDELLVSVSKVLEEFHIDSPLMVVRGDGSVMSQALARERPIDTILSGPASSINGANKLAGCLNSVVVDIGGTTTDIGVIRNGKPHLDPEGAFIGGYRTRVMAAEITTAGLGGDSRIILNGDRLYMSALRVTPLCVAASQYPSIRERLERLYERPIAEFPEVQYESNVIMDTEFFLKLKDPRPGMVSELDQKFIDLISEDPRSLVEARFILQENAASFNIARMEEFGLIQRVGLTPTDVMHARGVFTMYDAEASHLGAKIIARKIGMTEAQLLDRIDDLITDKISREILKKVIYEDTGIMEMEGFGNNLIDKVIQGKEGADFRFDMQLTKPIVGIGGPTYYMLPRVAERLGTELIIPDNYDVGNAVGAIIGKIEETIEFVIIPISSSNLIRHYYQNQTSDRFELASNLDSDPACTIFCRLGRFYLESFKDGLEFAENTGREFVTNAMVQAQAEDVEVKVSIKENLANLVRGQDILMSVEITVKAVGEPKSK